VTTNTPALMRALATRMAPVPAARMRSTARCSLIRARPIQLRSPKSQRPRPGDHPFLGPPRALVAQQEGVCCEPHSRVTWTTAKCLVKRAKRAWRALPHPGSETENSPNLPVLPCVRTSVSKALCREARRWLRSVVCAPSGHRSVQHTCNISGRLGPDLYALVHVSGRRAAPFVLVNAHFATLFAAGEWSLGFESLLRYAKFRGLTRMNGAGG